MHSDCVGLDSLDFTAPFLIERLCEKAIAESPEEGAELFAELKRWLILSQSDQSRLWPMYSLRVDEVWHQFILFTSEYAAFCERYFGHYVHHAPRNAPRPADADTKELVSFDLFCEEYARAFGNPVPDLWRDARSVTLDRRVLNPQAGRLLVREDDLFLQLVNPEARRFLLRDGEQTLHLVDSNGAEIMRVGAVARDALTFVATAPAFYVRELPGKLEPAEKISLVCALVDSGILTVA